MKSLTTRHYVYFGALILLALVLASCAGLDLGDIVKVKTPNTIQQTTGLPSTLSLNEAEVEYQNWFNLTQTTGAQWKGNIGKAGEIRGLLARRATCPGSARSSSLRFNGVRVPIARLQNALKSIRATPATRCAIVQVRPLVNLSTSPQSSPAPAPAHQTSSFRTTTRTTRAPPRSGPSPSRDQTSSPHPQET